MPDLTTPRPYILDEQIGYLLRLASQRHATIFLENAIYKLTATQFSALIRLHELGECSQNELGRRTAMDVATVKGVVDRLRVKGLITLRPDPNDRRRTLIRLAEGHPDLVPALHATGQEITRLTLAPLSKSERKTLLRLMRKMG